MPLLYLRRARYAGYYVLRAARYAAYATLMLKMFYA